MLRLTQLIKQKYTIEKSKGKNTLQQIFRKWDIGIIL